MSDYFDFTGLPAELRNMIYCKVFDGAINAPQYPWRTRREHEIEIETSNNLFLVSKQLRAECTYVFNIHYAHKPELVTLETVPDVYTVMWAATIDPVFAAADFILCGNTINSHQRNLVEDDICRFIFSQRGFGANQRAVFNRNKYATDMSDEDSQIGLRNARDEDLGIEGLGYPTFDNGMVLNVFKTLDDSSKDKFGLDHAVVLTGRVQDLYWSPRWNIDVFRRRASLRR